MTTDPSSPRTAQATLQSLTDTELSLRSRLWYVALMLAAMIMLAIVGPLWLTEPSLPLRTHVAFALMVIIGLSWAVFAALLARRRRLLANQGIIASRMAVAFTSLFAMGGFAASVTGGGAAALGATATGVVMVVVAILMLRRAHRKFAELTERRDALERELRPRQ